MSKEFEEPRVGLGKIYTRTGDDGTTALVGGQRVPKDDIRIEAYGAVDELNAVLGITRHELLQCQNSKLAKLADRFLHTQHALFNLGSNLATLPEDLHPTQPQITEEQVAELELDIDACNKELKPLQSFVLPGGSAINGYLHLARTVCRRAERHTVTLQRLGGCRAVDVHYLNRLSDALFVWSRWASHILGDDEVLWQPNAA